MLGAYAGAAIVEVTQLDGAIRWATLLAWSGLLPVVVAARWIRCTKINKRVGGHPAVVLNCCGKTLI